VAAIILASALAGRIGVFRLLARALIPHRGTAIASAAAILAFTALLSGLVNLDVAVVVAMPAALHAARSRGLAAGRLAVAVAITANATSFLLPTSNITSLLLLARRALPAAYLSDSWLPWILVTAVTIGPLSVWAARGTASQATPATAGPSAWAASSLVPMYLAACGIRALLGTGLVLHGSLAGQLAQGSALAAAASNLPVAAAITPASTPGLWAAILATTIGPNLLLTGSVATLIGRRIAGDSGARLGGFQFSAIGLALVPVQLAAATLGLHLTGALG
jgi:Na+/H+ antiporter NhaD/arsenite permease-like protein